MFRRFWSGLLLAVMLLLVPTAADAAVIIDPGYRQGGQELEFSLAYYTPSNTFTVHGDWQASEAFSVWGYLEVNEGDLVSGYLEGFNVFGPIGLSYGVAQDQGDLFYRAGLSGVFGQGAFGATVSGDVFYGEQEARGALRAAAIWQPADGMLFLAGLYAQGRYVLATDIWLEEFIIHPYLYGSVRRELGDFELQGTATVIIELDYDFELSLLYPLGDRGGIGGIVSLDGDPDGSDWWTEYGIKLEWRI